MRNMRNTYKRGLNMKIIDAILSIQTEFKHHFPDEFRNFGMVRVAEFLDPQSFWTIPIDDYKTVLRALKDFYCTEDEA